MKRTNIKKILWYSGFLCLPAQTASLKMKNVCYFRLDSVEMLSHLLFSLLTLSSGQLILIVVHWINISFWESWTFTEELCIKKIIMMRLDFYLSFPHQNRKLTKTANIVKYCESSLSLFWPQSLPDLSDYLMKALLTV